MADQLLWLLGHVTVELALFAAVGLLIGGIDDLAIDGVWLARGLRRRIVRRHLPRHRRGRVPPAARPGRIAVFVGAWDEDAVIGAMLETALDRFDHDDYRIFVGVYPNDPATCAEVRRVQATHPRGERVQIVSGVRPGPTTKAECLNRLWRALLDAEAADGVRIKAVVLHDAEDVVHSAELKLFDRMIEQFDLVQLPVFPLAVPGSPWVSMHYADEFAEAHGKQLVVREALGAGIPSAGVGCAIARDALQEMADRAGGAPFDAESLTEDYELGLRLRDAGRRGAFVRARSGDEGGLIAVRAYFPATVNAAVHQKARWMAGIALAGWDRLGWSGGLAERWMRLRDRRALLTALVLAAAYGAMLAAAASSAIAFAIGRDYPDWPPLLWTLSQINLLFLLWRAGMRMWMVARVYGWRQGLRSVPRMIVGNVIAMMAAWRAVRRYLGAIRGGGGGWGKTAHAFPAVLPAE